MDQAGHCPLHRQATLMKAQYANAVVAKARALYGNMLSPGQYDELMHKKSVPEISSYLRDKTTYAPALSGVQDSTIHRGQLENLLHKDMFYQYVRLAKYVRGKQDIYQYVIMDMEIGLILSCLRNIISSEGNDFIASLPTFIQPYANFNVFDLVNIKSVGQLYEVLKNTPYGPVIRKCMEENPQQDGPIDYTAYEISLRTYYFETLLQRVGTSLHGRAAQQARQLVTLRAELMNINSIYRLKTYFHASPAQIRKAVLPFSCKISKRTMDALIETRDARSFMQMLVKTPYGGQIAPDTEFIESRTDLIRYRYALKLLRFSTDPRVVFMSFMLLRGMETENIIRVIEGVRYGIAPDKIEKLLFKP